jgi:integrase
MGDTSEHPSSRRPNISPAPEDSRYSFILNIPATHSHTGKRIRRYFHAEKEAKKELTRLSKVAESHGKTAASIPTRLLNDALEAQRLLNEGGSTKSLTDAVRSFLKISKERDTSTTMEKALEAWKAAPKANGQTKRPDTQAEIATLAKWFEKPFAPSFVSEMTAEKVVSFLETIGRDNEQGAVSPRAINKRITLVSGFFSYCEKRGWCDGSIIKRLKAKRKPVEEKESKQPGILTPEEFATLLEKAAAVDSSLVDYLAVCGLAGVRPEEAARLNFSHFKPEEGDDGIILIPDGAAKTRKGRDVPIPPALRLWLSRAGGFYDRAKANALEPLVRFQGQPLDKKLARVRYLAGWRVKLRGYTPAKPEARPYPADSLRHTFASAFLAEGGDTAALVWSFGHAGSLQTLRRHYVHRYTKAEAGEWFAVIPSGTMLPSSIRIVEPAPTKGEKREKRKIREVSR